MNFSKSFPQKIFALYLISLIYAIIRYNVFGNVPWADIPFFITNKAVSLTVMMLLLFSLYQKENVFAVRKKLLKLIFALTSWHIFISFVLLSPEYYGKFYSNNLLNITGYSVITFGIVAYAGVLFLNCEIILKKFKLNLSISENHKKSVRRLIPIFIAGHLLVMGFRGWLTPAKWYGYLFPISLLAFLLLVAYVIKMWRLKR